jgi:hypothetical protein
MLEVLFGGLITWLAAWWYYQRAGNDLRQVATELRERLAVVSLHVTPGATGLARDKNGNVTGIVQEVDATNSLGLDNSVSA